MQSAHALSGMSRNAKVIGSNTADSAILIVATRHVSTARPNGTRQTSDGPQRGQAPVHQARAAVACVIVNCEARGSGCGFNKTLLIAAIGQSAFQD